jgi:hypothetical protein
MRRQGLLTELSTNSHTSLKSGIVVDDIARTKPEGTSDRSKSTRLPTTTPRRQSAHEFGTQTLMPIRSLAERLRVWPALTANTMELSVSDIDGSEFLSTTIKEVKLEAVIHFAQQRATLLNDRLQTCYLHAVLQ